MIAVDVKLCEMCGTCSGVCSVDAIYIMDKRLVIDHEKCILCLACVKVCPVSALYRAVEPKNDGFDIPSESEIRTV